MRDNRILFGVLGAGLLWSAAAIAQGPFVTMPFYAPVDLTNTTPRQVLWQQESSGCDGTDRFGPDNERNTSDDFGLPGNPPLSASVFILDPDCAVVSSDLGAQWEANLFENTLPGLPPGTDISEGYVVDFTSDGTTATVSVAAALWDPILQNTVNVAGLVTVTPGTVSDYVFKIDVASGDVKSFGWTANANTVLGPASLNVALMGMVCSNAPTTSCIQDSQCSTPLPAGTCNLEPGIHTANWYSSESTQAPGASGAVPWACGTGGFIAQPNNNPLADPGSLGTCPPNLVNPSPTTTNTPYDSVKGSLFANASTKVLGLTPRAWAPLDGRLSELTPEPGALLLGASALVALGVLGRRRDA